MTMHSTTNRVTTTASALSIGLLLCGSLAMAADTPAAPLSSAAPPAATYPHWTAEQRQQHWAQMQQSARELWAKWGLTPEQRQQYLAQMQQGWRDLEAMMKPPVTAAAAAAVAAVTPTTAPAAAATYPPGRVQYMWALWGMTPEQRQQYWETMQRGGKG